MKAISLRPEWAMPVLMGDKFIEWRSWPTDYRGPLVICSSARKTPGAISGMALCKVDLVEVEPFAKKHMKLALMDDTPDGYAWIFDNLDWIEPFEQKGKLRLFEVDDSAVKVIPETIGSREAFMTYYEPHMHYGRDPEVRAEWMGYIDSL